MNTFGHVCTHCGGVDKIPRAIAFYCAGCQAQPGDSCVDMRTVTTTRKPVGYLHNERQALLLDADRHAPMTSALPSAETYVHVCERCGETGELLRSVTFFCVQCKARPGEGCVDAKTFASTRRPVDYIHVGRRALLRVVDAGRPKSEPPLRSAVAV